MKLSLNWIRDYVAIPEDFDLKQLAFDLTMSTVEVEGVEELARRFDGIVVGEIKEVNPHPNADKLRVCKVDIADGTIHDIVCGGSNLEVGQLVVVACPGSFVRWHGEGDLVEIKNTKLRGVPSFGMICAAVEVGLADLFPTEDDHAIMDVTSFGAPAGTPLAKALDLDDVIRQQVDDQPSRPLGSLRHCKRDLGFVRSAPQNLRALYPRCRGSVPDRDRRHRPLPPLYRREDGRSFG